MKTSTMLGGLIGSAIDGAKGDDSSLDGALIGAGVATVARVVIPIAVTFAVGWFALRGLDALAGSVLGSRQSQV